MAMAFARVRSLADDLNSALGGSLAKAVGRVPNLSPTRTLTCVASMVVSAVGLLPLLRCWH
jgi:hypothetical protein